MEDIFELQGLFGSLSYVRKRTQSRKDLQLVATLNLLFLGKDHVYCQFRTLSESRRPRCLLPWQAPAKHWRLISAIFRFQQLKHMA